VNAGCTCSGAGQKSTGGPSSDPFRLLSRVTPLDIQATYTKAPDFSSRRVRFGTRIQYWRSALNQGGQVAPAVGQSRPTSSICRGW